MTFKGKAMIVTKFFGIYLVPSYSYLTRQALIKFCSDLIRQIRLLIDICRDRNRMKFDNFLVYCIFFYHKFSCYRLSLISLIVNTRSEGHTTFRIKQQVLIIHLKMTTISWLSFQMDIWRWKFSLWTILIMSNDMIRENLVFCCIFFSFNTYFQACQGRRFFHKLNQISLNQFTLLVTQKYRSLIIISCWSLLNCYLIASSLCTNIWNLSCIRKGYSVVSLSRLKVFKRLVTNRETCNSTFCFLITCDKGCCHLVVISN